MMIPRRTSETDGDIQVILATDIGSTTTKAILIQKKGSLYRLAARGETPTTVEAPWENVMIGVRKSIRRIEEITGRRILDDRGYLIRPWTGEDGVDLYVSTSSAGGGLQMMVAGLVKNVSASSANRAALGAGAVVLDVVAVASSVSGSGTDLCGRATLVRRKRVLPLSGEVLVRPYPDVRDVQERQRLSTKS